MTQKILSEPIAFPTSAALGKWLKAHHAKSDELWVRIYKKDSGVPSVTWNDCVLQALAWGWIDGQKKSLDSASFLQRLSPRRPKSGWSKKNRENAERLIAAGLMQSAGLSQVDAAKSDGRWESAYAGSADMEIPQDFMAALAKEPAAMDFFATLNRANLFAIYHRLHTAKKPATRTARIERIVAQLAERTPPH